MNWRTVLDSLPKDESIRGQFAARTKSEARVSALIIIYKLIESYLDEGQPYEVAEDWGIPEKDADRLHTEIQEFKNHLDLRIQRALEAELRRKS